MTPINEISVINEIKVPRRRARKYLNPMKSS